ncbi:MAG: nicotinamide-nucleotide amidohydrolase family protein [Lachnospiraceae bacterium]|nr:nicotinamide-nucleotide amidohydrolase family protein [Lachnospiraceae bacterium]
MTIVNEIAEKLIDKRLKIAVSESCTGGLLAASLIDYPGISEVFEEGCVTYSNEAKMRRLSVKAETLEKYGAVSFETACEMAEGIAKSAGTDIGISTTGIAGPGGGSYEKPVGLVYIGMYINGKAEAKKYIFEGDRLSVRTQAVEKALLWLREELK